MRTRQTRMRIGIRKFMIVKGRRMRMSMLLMRSLVACSTGGH